MTYEFKYDHEDENGFTHTLDVILKIDMSSEEHPAHRGVMTYFTDIVEIRIVGYDFPVEQLRRRIERYFYQFKQDDCINAYLNER